MILLWLSDPSRAPQLFQLGRGGRASKRSGVLSWHSCPRGPWGKCEASHLQTACTLRPSLPLAGWGCGQLFPGGLEFRELSGALPLPSPSASPAVEQRWC